MSINSARWLRKGFLAIVAVFFLVLVSACGGSNAVHVYDKAGVLDQNRVQNEASSLPYSMDIYTVNTFTGTKAEFDQTTLAKLGNNSNLIVMAVDTVHHHLAIVRGSNVPLSKSQIQAAVNAFSSNFGSANYTGASIATIDSLHNSLGVSSGSPGGGLFSGLFGTLCIVGLVILGVILLLGVLARRRWGGYRGSAPMGMPYQPPFNQGYPPNYYGPPGYNQGPGMNPWAAGGLGAAAGGFLGYELGKEAGEREAGEQQQGDGGWAGASGDFGGGGGGDSGGGGGDSGGGASGDFGGGGGGDSGGGGSGDF